MSQRVNVAVIGLDSVPPSLLFDRFRGEMPVLDRLLRNGFYGPLRSTIPPITVPAWTSMMTSWNPGRLGFTGFRNRTWGSYEEGWIATNRNVRAPRVWEILGRAGKRSAILSVPQTYPPRPFPGLLVSGFLTPPGAAVFTHPTQLREEIEAIAGPFQFDVENYRTDERDRLIREIEGMTHQHLEVARYLVTRKAWDFFMVVLMGPDRLHHAFWQFHDPGHRKFDPTSPYRETMRRYYRMLDRELGRFLAALPPETHLLVVSDHGSKAMKGCFHINDWLIERGYLRLKHPPSGIQRLREVEIDWPATRAWAWGGYYARIFLNVRGREPMGAVEPEAFEEVRETLRQEILAIPDDAGNPMATRVYRPEEIYPGSVREVPDLLVFFDDLDWRVTESIGHGGLYSFDTELGPDGAVHDWQGVLAISGPKVARRGEVAEMSIYDVAPTILSLFDLPVPPNMEGKPIPLA